MPAHDLKNRSPKASLCISENRSNFNFLTEKFFEETFLVLPTLGNILIGMSFVKKYSVTLDLQNNLVHFPDLSLEVKPHHGKFRCGAFELKTLQKVVVGPFQQVMVPNITATEIDNSFKITEATTAFNQQPDFILTPAVNQLQDGRTTSQFTNPNAHMFIISHGGVVANFKKLKPVQASHVQPMSLEQPTLVFSHPGDPTMSSTSFFGPRFIG